MKEKFMFAHLAKRLEKIADFWDFDDSAMSAEKSNQFYEIHQKKTADFLKKLKKDMIKIIREIYDKQKLLSEEIYDTKNADEIEKYDNSLTSASFQTSVFEEDYLKVGGFQDEYYRREDFGCTHVQKKLKEIIEEYRNQLNTKYKSYIDDLEISTNKLINYINNEVPSKTDEPIKLTIDKPIELT